MPTIAGVAMTLCALAVGAAFAGRDAEVRPAAAVAAAMRNPGLALVIATVNPRAARGDGRRDRLRARSGRDDGGVRAMEQAAVKRIPHAGSSSGAGTALCATAR